MTLKITDNEDDEKTTVGKGIYMKYFKMGGGLCFIISAVILVGMWVGGKAFNDYWMGYISKQPDQLSSMGYYFSVMAAIVVLTGVMVVGRVYIFTRASLNVSKRIHMQAVERVLRAPLNLFFDKTPTGRIQNRFSKDQSNVDTETALNFMGSLNNLIFLLT